MTGAHSAPRPRPIDPDEFAAAMAALAPFEARPTLAVACSGGSDSLALAHLAQAWARARRGKSIALIVDHRLRPGSAADARKAARLARRLGLTARVLTRKGPPPRADIQASARAARYALLEDGCRRAGVLHLLLAHHAEDQAETLLLRLQRGSGLDGLAAMPAIAERRECRLLRPLLGFSKARLAATLAATGLEAINDPANASDAFARVRLRRAVAELELDPARLAATATHLGRARAALGDSVLDGLAASVVVEGDGNLLIDPDAIRALPEEVGLRVLARALLAVGGDAVTPRFARLRLLYDALPDLARGGGRTLAHCRITRAKGRLRLMPERPIPKTLLRQPLGPGAFGVVTAPAGTIF
ncbi:MAG: tRNA lysidine(34) synthetase TilS [Alphaproteobacteria bacterium]|nr:tRNA lysidine(34) synthetase TilS [Alphaproteobacteria bacterium]